MPTFKHLSGIAKRRFFLFVHRSILSRKGTLLFWLLVIFPTLFFLIYIIVETVKAENTGFDKTLWQWMDLLLVPAALGIGVWGLNRAEKARERETTKDQLRESALQAYFDTMTELLLEHDSKKHPVNDLEINHDKEKKRKSLARSRTLSILKGLGKERKEQVIQFLYESELIKKPIFVGMKLADLANANFKGITLEGACLNGVDLSNSLLDEAKMEGAELRQANLRWSKMNKSHMSLADLSNANMENANMKGAILSDAILREAYLHNVNLRDSVLRGADFRNATLSNADLRNSNLEGADFRRAILKGAKVSVEQLNKALSFEGATMPNGEKHEEANPNLNNKTAV